MNQNQVDMLGEARNAQWSAQTFLGEDYLRIISPAKVNLFLDIKNRQADGYHELATVFHALSLTDTLYMTSSAMTGGEDGGVGSKTATTSTSSDDLAFAGPAGNIAVQIEIADKTGSFGPDSDLWGSSTAPSVKDNLVFKAIDNLAKSIGHSKDEQMTIRIEKSIPAAAGLGGGSSNAAAALLGAARIWGVSDSGETIKDVARELGADVSFFLHGGCCSFEGRGDVFERKLTPSNAPLVLVKPSSGVSTAKAYEEFDMHPEKVSAEDWVEFQNASAADEVPLINNLTDAAIAINPEVAKVIEWLLQHVDTKPLMSGSGSAVFAKTETYADALTLVAAAKQHGWWARATTFSPLRAYVIEAK